MIHQLPFTETASPINLFGISAATSDLAAFFPIQKAKRNSLNGMLILLILQGNAQVEIDSTRQLLSKGSLVCIPPNHLLKMCRQSANFQVEYLFFEFDFMADFPLLLHTNIPEQMGSNPCPQTGKEIFAVLQNYFDLIYHRYNCEAPINRTEIIKGLLFSFLTEISCIYSQTDTVRASSRNKEIADGFFRLLHLYYKEQCSASFYADKLNLTDKYLSRIIKQVTGNTFYFWISEFILKEAKLLLKSTNMSITEISEVLNFPNSSFFAQFFKRHVGMTPMQFKKETTSSHTRVT